MNNIQKETHMQVLIDKSHYNGFGVRREFKGSKNLFYKILMLKL